MQWRRGAANVAAGLVLVGIGFSAGLKVESRAGQRAMQSLQDSLTLEQIGLGEQHEANAYWDGFMDGHIFSKPVEARIEQLPPFRDPVLTITSRQLGRYRLLFEPDGEGVVFRAEEPKRVQPPQPSAPHPQYQQAVYSPGV